jgi:hypothetical protein
MRLHARPQDKGQPKHSLIVACKSNMWEERGNPRVTVIGAHDMNRRTTGDFEERNKSGEVEGVF